MNFRAFRCFLSLVFLVVSSGVSAVGLGELRGNPDLGDRPRLEIELLGADNQNIESSCFRLIQPKSTGDLPWLKKATLVVRKGKPLVLEIRSDVPLSEPILELAVHIGCGQEVSRQYVLLASPVKDGAPPVVDPRPLREASISSDSRSASRNTRHIPVAARSDDAPQRLVPRRQAGRHAATGMPDRVMLSSGVDVGEPSLRLATELFSVKEVKEAQREILRLEFRMLMVLNEQATSQLATAEKLRNMEATLGELQQRAVEFAQRVEKGSPAEGTQVPVADSPKVQPAIPPVGVDVVKPARLPAPAIEESSGLSEWSLYGALLGALLGIGAWLGWKNYRERQQRRVEEEFQLLAPAIAVDPQHIDEFDDAGQVDLHVEPSFTGMATPVDLELDGGAHGSGKPTNIYHNVPAVTQESVMSISSTTVDEHFEANPVMELADIMLSFGRVKGAAQALQEYIDNNPEEALQPWIRLMDVYRMAGMRSEFETVATNLNQHFNVEVQQWDVAQSVATPKSVDFALDGGDAPLPVAPRPESLEDMPRIMSMICELWGTGDVVGYLYQLLRDNRGGKRLGFALPVVEETLFLIELKETSNRIE
ncbi:MAG: hypothetical protein Q8S26_16690 [Azonexus sp.]|nr:hypothetical protein [Azonexus sp.]